MGIPEVTHVVISSFSLGNVERRAMKDEGQASVEVCLGVEGIELHAHHGVYDEEQERGSRFRIDVDMMGRWGEAVRSDDLRDTLDVDAVVQHIRSVNQRRRFHLIESFAGAIADDLLQEFPRLLEVRVCIRKLAFPEWGPEACAFAVVTKR
ncbi:MAG: dihydroneopterin aldolase [Chloroflexi bacterium]|nr:dihydroneopterin aldolase [Chloroflexota bacterium]